jgi:hypothetical protein
MFAILKFVKIGLATAASTVIQWLFVAFHNDIMNLDVVGDITVEDILSVATEYYNFETGELNLGSFMVNEINDIIDNLCLEITGISLDNLNIELPPIEILVDVPALGTIINFLTQGSNESMWYWLFESGIGPQYLIELENWIEDATGYILSEGVSGSGALDDIIQAVATFLGLWPVSALIETLNIIQNIADYLVAYNQFAEQYNLLRLQLMASFTSSADDWMQSLLNLIDPYQLADIVSQIEESVGVELSNVDEIIDQLKAHITDAITTGIESIEDLLDLLPVMPIVQEDLLAAAEALNLTFSFTNIPDWLDIFLSDPSGFKGPLPGDDTEFWDFLFLLFSYWGNWLVDPDTGEPMLPPEVPDPNESPGEESPDEADPTDPVTPITPPPGFRDPDAMF